MFAFYVCSVERPRKRLRERDYWANSRKRMSLWDRQRMNRYGCTDTCASVHIHSAIERAKRMWSPCECSIEGTQIRTQSHTGSERQEIHTSQSAKETKTTGEIYALKVVHWQCVHLSLCDWEKCRPHACETHSRSVAKTEQHISRYCKYTHTEREGERERVQWIGRERESDVEDDSAVCEMCICQIHIQISLSISLDCIKELIYLQSSKAKI